MVRSVNDISFCLEQVDKIEDSFDVINSGTKPLAAYLFTNNKRLKEQFVTTISAGGMIVNDTVIHVILLTFTFRI
jgi:aldehyde dehydrogenase (NAD+)